MSLWVGFSMVAVQATVGFTAGRLSAETVSAI
jgi:hypothetical protein